MSTSKAISPTGNAQGDDALESSASASASNSSAPPQQEMDGDLGGNIDGTVVPGRSDGKPKRTRKVQGKVAIIACLECRRTRSKCDGVPSKPCARCRSKGYRCVYQPHTKIQKDEILHDLEQERGRAESLSQRNHELSMILQVISEDGHLDEIVQRLRNKEDAKSITSWLNSLPDLTLFLKSMSLATIDVEGIVEHLGQAHNIRSVFSNEAYQLPRTRWTQVTEDITFLDYLVRLYLDCIHPKCMLFNGLAFLETYRTGSGVACSKALLNAVCAMACNILDRRYIGNEQDASNLIHLQETFSTEAKSSISLADSQDIRSVQAMAVLYLVELSSGRARSAITYLRCASECLSSLELDHDPSPDFDMSRWGIHSLDIISCALSFRSPLPLHTVNTLVMFDKDEDYLEQFSRNAEVLLSKVPAKSRLVVKMAACQARLCQSVNAMTLLYGGYNGPITPQAVFSCFNRYIQLFDSMPQVLQQVENSQNGLDIRALHIKFYSMISTLWLPLVSFAQAQQNVEMFNDCRYQVLESSRKGIELVEGVLQDYSCESLPPQHTFCVMNICDTVARWTPNRAERLNAIHTCFKLLDSNTMNFRLCRLLKKLFRCEIEKFVEPETMKELKKEYEVHQKCTFEEALDASNRLTYMISFPSLTKWLDEGFQAQWPEAWIALTTANTPGTYPGSVSRTTSSSSSNAMRLENICN